MEAPSVQTDDASTPVPAESWNPPRRALWRHPDTGSARGARKLLWFARLREARRIPQAKQAPCAAGVVSTSNKAVPGAHSSQTHQRLAFSCGSILYCRRVTQQCSPQQGWRPSWRVAGTHRRELPDCTSAERHCLLRPLTRHDVHVPARLKQAHGAGEAADACADHDCKRGHVVRPSPRSKLRRSRAARDSQGSGPRAGSHVAGGTHAGGSPADAGTRSGGPVLRGLSSPAGIVRHGSRMARTHGSND